MQSQFGILLDMLRAAFESPVSQANYHDIVSCMRHYKEHREAREAEQRALAEHGWPVDYDPLYHMENIRFAMAFVRDDHDGVSNAVREYWSHCVPMES